MSGLSLDFEGYSSQMVLVVASGIHHGMESIEGQIYF
jgi:hypothetical protein